MKYKVLLQINSKSPKYSMISGLKLNLNSFKPLYLSFEENMFMTPPKLNFLYPWSEYFSIIFHSNKCLEFKN